MQYIHNITLTDSEVIMLTDSLKRTIKHCNRNLIKGAPYWAHKESAKSVLKKIYKEIETIFPKPQNKFL